MHVHAALVAAVARDAGRLLLHAPLVAVVQFFQRHSCESRDVDLDLDEAAGPDPPQTNCGMRAAARRPGPCQEGRSPLTTWAGAPGRCAASARARLALKTCLFESSCSFCVFVASRCAAGRRAPWPPFPDREPTFSSSRVHGAAEVRHKSLATGDRCTYAYVAPGTPREDRVHARDTTTSYVRPVATSWPRMRPPDARRL